MGFIGGDEALLNELIEIFLEETPKQLVILEQSIAASNFPIVERTAHTLKGELSYLGLCEGAEKCRVLEGLSRERRLEEAVEVLHALKSELVGVIARMKAKTSNMNAMVAVPPNITSIQ